ncbi:unnamed protein product [Lasius platythorax]|uniref:Uncharacterized protein n=1 Tax=Lasius platythorax TaxID=488582 RepID=A0AAV2P1U5_9HYME
MSLHTIHGYHFSFYIYTIVLLLTIHASLAPTNTYAIPIKLSERTSFKPISYVTSKIMGTVVKTISSIDQWFPRISWMKPTKSKLTVVQPINTYHRDVDDFSSEE